MRAAVERWWEHVAAAYRVLNAKEAQLQVVARVVEARAERLQPKVRADRGDSAKEEL